ncbi:DUF4280 domain-containing protein [Mucilaginibacter robiniae]|uniref:DUF4280 domain-containing protein n=1 Tax=Mucilaginibacter robiniae TaxID=2728022 RepID=A0A7L5E880_9SPHI|nr:DUF4280 domain-containing protein [Mucilaginibacter robiniae]QJD96556.1 DUF4280 domain-containing protein [Mucilaginibacter robiniae]
MAQEHLVVQGATCQCNFGTATDKLKVLSQQKEYANDQNSAFKLIANTKDLGTTFEKNTFGSCSKQNNRVCTAVVSEWKHYFEEVVLSNGGKILLENSKATCPIGGPECIRIVLHGQSAELSKQNFKNAQPAVANALNPAVDLKEMDQPEEDIEGLIFQ